MTSPTSVRPTSTPVPSLLRRPRLTLYLVYSVGLMCDFTDATEDISLINFSLSSESIYILPCKLCVFSGVVKKSAGKKHSALSLGNIEHCLKTETLRLVSNRNIFSVYGSTDLICSILNNKLIEHSESVIIFLLRENKRQNSVIYQVGHMNSGKRQTDNALDSELQRRQSCMFT